MVSPNLKKALIYSPFALAAIYAGYKLFIHHKEKKGLNPNETKQPTAPKPLKGVVIANVDCTFPLKHGMTNDCIKQLQSILDITPQSGYFGDKTEAALLEQTGKKQIDSLADFNYTIQSIIAHDNGDLIKRQNIGGEIIATYNDLLRTFNMVNFGGASNKITNKLYFSEDTTLYNTDDSGNSFVMYVSKGNTLSLNDYAPDAMNAEGNLKLVCSTGGNTGTWIVKPDNITIQ